MFFFRTQGAVKRGNSVFGRSVLRSILTADCADLGFQSPDPRRSRSVLTQRRKDAKAKDHVTAKGAKNAEVETERSRSVSSAWSAYSAVQLRAGLTADAADGRGRGDRRIHSLTLAATRSCSRYGHPIMLALAATRRDYCFSSLRTASDVRLACAAMAASAWTRTLYVAS